MSCLAANQAQDWVRTGTNLGQARIRMAVADFKPVGADPDTPALKATFDATLYSDLANAGIFDLVSKTMAPQAIAGLPAGDQPAAVVRGPRKRGNGGLRGAIVDQTAGSPSTAGSTTPATPPVPQVLGKQYNEAASQDMARTVAHRFADEIISRLGGGINGIAETKIYFVSSRTGTKEIWAMDYDGQNQHQITHLGSVSLSPRISPDGSRLAFASLDRNGWSVRMYSLELGRMVNFPAGGGRWHQSISCVVGGRNQNRLLLVAIGGPGNLGGGRRRRKSA